MWSKGRMTGRIVALFAVPLALSETATAAATVIVNLCNDTNGSNDSNDSNDSNCTNDTIATQTATPTTTTQTTTPNTISPKYILIPDLDYKTLQEVGPLRKELIDTVRNFVETYLSKISLTNGGRQLMAAPAKSLWSAVDGLVVNVGAPTKVTGSVLFTITLFSNDPIATKQITAAMKRMQTTKLEQTLSASSKAKVAAHRATQAKAAAAANAAAAAQAAAAAAAALAGVVKPTTVKPILAPVNPIFATTTVKPILAPVNPIFAPTGSMPASVDASENDALERLVSDAEINLFSSIGSAYPSLAGWALTASVAFAFSASGFVALRRRDAEYSPTAIAEE